METFEWDQLGRTALLAEGHQLNTAELLFEKIEDETIPVSYTHLGWTRYTWPVPNRSSYLFP